MAGISFFKACKNMVMKGADSLNQLCRIARSGKDYGHNDFPLATEAPICSRNNVRDSLCEEPVWSSGQEMDQRN